MAIRLVGHATLIPQDAIWRAQVEERELLGHKVTVVGACLHEHRSWVAADKCARRLLKDVIAFRQLGAD